MHPSRNLALAKILTLAFALSCAAADPTTESATSASAPEVTTLLADFRTTLPDIFSSGSWQGKIAVSPSGYVIQGNKGADGKGELGQKLATPIDLANVKYVELALGVGARNEVPEVTLAFTDADDTQYTATIRIDQVLPQQAIWFRVRLADFKLNDWQGNKAGRKLDWTRIAQWHLQGDWRTAAPFHVIFVALRTRQ